MQMNYLATIFIIQSDTDAYHLIFALILNTTKHMLHFFLGKTFPCNLIVYPLLFLNQHYAHTVLVKFKKYWC